MPKKKKAKKVLTKVRDLTEAEMEPVHGWSARIRLMQQEIQALNNKANAYLAKIEADAGDGCTLKPSENGLAIFK